MNASFFPHKTNCFGCGKELPANTPVFRRRRRGKKKRIFCKTNCADRHFSRVGPPKRKAAPQSDFYLSREWKELRYEAFLRYGRECLVCGSTKKPLHVDHIKPRYKYPELELDINNLQILCALCNIGKGAWDQTDWRKKDSPKADTTSSATLVNSSADGFGISIIEKEKKREKKEVANSVSSFVCGRQLERLILGGLKT